MGYSDWFQKHGEKHKAIIQKLKKAGLSKQEIIAYFEFDNMRQKEPGFCPLYARNTRCHEMENLNCFLCGCPFFRFKDSGLSEKEGLSVFSHCSIHAKKGREHVGKKGIHHDCSQCLIPHKAHFIGLYFDEEWGNIMRACEVR